MTTTERDELAREIFMADNDAAADPAHEWEMLTRHNPASTDYAFQIADGLIQAGYRKIFDGDCGLSGIKSPDDREAAEAWMRFSNLAMDDEIGAIGAMKRMLAELGYRKEARK